ncbi:condensation domain-containing protein [Kocuria sp. AG109]|uniref:peptide synthetase n=1 Tax=Rothia kristinae TaxID=37923 RepID=UPI000C26A5E9|nr:peptide synthetase [Rothia kristinae]MED6045689.1 peptide synthetase [Rothia kristinae]TDP56671.1 condensation domain-containing protein [Kocuria sp. AG109]
MRLTNITRLRLPFGRLMGYDVAVSAPGRQLPISFDQQRHVGAGERPGSWMALTFTLPGPVPRERLSDAWLAVIARHQTLRTVFLPGEPGEGPHLHVVEVGPGAWREHEIAPGQEVNAALGEVFDAACTPYARPSHRLCVVETAAGPTVAIAADHAHVDMWSMLVILRDFLAALRDAEASASAAARTGPRPAVLGFPEHTAALERMPPAPPEIAQRWAEILGHANQSMPRFPLPLGDPRHQPERVEVREILDVAGLAAYAAHAREAGVSSLAQTVSVMTRITRELAGIPLRAVFPVHSRYDETWHDSVGWFITNSVLESPDPEPAACAAAVKEAVRLGSWPLRPILAPWGGMPETPGMFAISWLDLRRLPVQVENAASLEAQYVSAAIRTDGVMIWFILSEDGAHLRCRYPDSPQARESVGGWLDALVAGMQELAA